MPDFEGPIQQVDVDHGHYLWLIALLPFLGACVNAIYSSGLLAKAVEAFANLARSDEDQRHAPRKIAPNSVVRAVALSAMLGAFAVTVYHVVQLVSLKPDHRYLLSHVWRMARFGLLDINFDFAMDPLSGLMCCIITGVGSLIHVYASSYMENDPDYWRFFAWLNLFVFSMLLLVLGDNFFVMFFGWEGVGLCSYGLIGFWWKDYKKATAGMKAFVVNRIGDFGFITGLAMLFWGLGGAWTPESDYAPDLDQRFVAAAPAGEEAAASEEREEEPGGPEGSSHAKAEHKDAAQKPESGQKPDTTGQGYLTMTAYPGALLYLDDSRTEMKEGGKPLTPPFVRHQLPGGYHSLRIQPGNGVDDQLVRHVAFGGDKEVIVTLIGPTVTFRQIRDQLAIHEGHDPKGKHTFLEALKDRRTGSHMLITVACLLLFLGACGKSAQVPLYVWLPDAMAGPTPVSALIHAATMVTAGVYLIARLSFVFSLSPTACGVVSLVGAFTALFAASMGFFQYDIKKVLAYSTVSQLGFMFIGVGVGAYWAGVFHLMTHAFFKACLFLAAGSVIHGMHAVEHGEVASQDMRNMGGLKKVMPLTRWTYLLACMAITAVPPGLAGFWSKDEILFKAFTTKNIAHVSGVTIYVMGLTAAAFTSFYMWRSYYLTFEGTPRNPKVLKDVHESPNAMTYVLATLAGLSVIAGVLFGASWMGKLFGLDGPILESWLEPVLSQAKVHFAEPGATVEYGLMGLSVGLAISAWAVARYFYGENRAKDWDTKEQRVPGFTTLHNKYWVDEIYAATIVKAVLKLRLVLAGMDKYVVDGIVNGVSVVTRVVAWINGWIDSTFVDGAVNFLAEGTLKAGHKLRGLQTGRIQNYIYGALGGVAFFALLQYFLAFNK
jgi:NADH-quinone oxidoreductase subunit L